MGKRSAACAAAALLLAIPALFPAHAQYFGRNKVRYESFDFEVLKTEHFDIHFYADEEAGARDVGRMAERWYARLSELLNHELSGRKPIILYADDTDFMQTNVVPGVLSQGTRGVTEGFKNRLVMPLTGSLAETDHVLGHEMVHVFQYDMAARGAERPWRLANLPLWMVEGMAEYLSVGRFDPHTAMWMRDAVRRDELPSLRELATDPRFFPYRFGQAFWSYIAGRWGDDIVPQLFAASGRGGVEAGFQSTLGISADEVLRDWHDELRNTYAVEGPVPPAELGQVVVSAESGGGRINIAPSVSPDGRYVAFLSEKDLFSIDLYLADAGTGEILKKLTSASTDPHVDALRFIDSAGSWSPDGLRFVYVTFAKGDNEIAILDVEERKVARRLRVKGVSALSNPAWSPDGTTIAFSAVSEETSDLFLLDLETGKTRRLTRDAYADLTPAWSPDGATLAVATDRGRETDLGRLTYGHLGIGIIDAETGELRRLLRPFFSAKHVSPHFGADGTDLYFVSDATGVSDLYRYDLDEERVYRLTRTETGVTGISDSSPCLSVAQGTGDVMFSVFDAGAYDIYRLNAALASGELFSPGTPEAVGYLPPPEPADGDAVASYLSDATTGLAPSEDFETADYKSRFGLDYLGQIGVGVGVDRFGGFLGGGVSAFFSDMLGNHNLGVGLQVNGGLKDVGARGVYQNLKGRVNWGVGISHISYRILRTRIDPTTVVVDGQEVRANVIEEELERVFVERAMLQADYPLSSTRRIEMGVGASYYSYDVEATSFLTVGNVLLDEEKIDRAAPAGFGLGEASLALVGDNSFFGFTSPIKGSRYRFEVSPVFGSLKYQNILADYRRYERISPVTFAFRALHFGRYGADAENDRISTLFLGYPTLIRGYDINTISATECGDGEDCPVFDRLLGSRIGVANLELRTQLLGTDQFGLVSFPFLPTEVAAFFDAGMAWSSDEQPELTFSQRSRKRVPVFSVGASARIALFGALPMEFYLAHPFQRPAEDLVFGFNLAPGW